MDFQEADRRYVDIKRSYESGGLTQEELGEQLKQLMVQDEEGRWWASPARLASGITTMAPPGLSAHRLATRHLKILQKISRKSSSLRLFSPRP